MTQKKPSEQKTKHESVATPPGEAGQDSGAVGMGEGSPEAVAANAPHAGKHGSNVEPDTSKTGDFVRGTQAPAHVTEAKTAYRGSKVQRARGTSSALDAERAARNRAAGAALAPGLPAALRTLASDDRVTVRRDGTPDPAGKTVVYWMQRAERGMDNHALNCAVHVANELGLPLVVFFAGISNFPHANLRHYAFLNQGLQDVEEDLAKRNISFVLRNAPNEDHLRFFADAEAAIVIGDENPMRVPEGWRRHIAEHLTVPFWTVDADVIVPSKRFDKAQYAAYTIRPRLWKMVPEYLMPYDQPHAKHAWKRPRGFLADDPKQDMTRGWTGLDRSVAPVELQGGAHAALARLKLFLQTILPQYDHTRNHPEVDGTSLLSPYLHYGHISPLRIMLDLEGAVEANPHLRESADAFLDELVTWRELTVNWVKYDPNYDNPECAEPWARKTVEEHAKDTHEVIYSAQQMERAETADELWNAAQRQMVRRGWMHNFMRMYWAKKVLEWSPSNAEAQKTLIYLNDKYFLDGRDPGGYAGIAWAVYGKFDRPWNERPIFGKIRYMSGASSGKKFNSKLYIAQNR